MLPETLNKEFYIVTTYQHTAFIEVFFFLRHLSVPKNFPDYVLGKTWYKSNLICIP